MSGEDVPGELGVNRYMTIREWINRFFDLIGFYNGATIFDLGASPQAVLVQSSTSTLVYPNVSFQQYMSLNEWLNKCFQVLAIYGSSYSMQLVPNPIPKVYRDGLPGAVIPPVDPVDPPLDPLAIVYGGIGVNYNTVAAVY